LLRNRALIAVAVAVASYIGALGTADIGFLWRAALALRAGADPYATVGAPFLYPLPAAVLALPLTVFSETVATKGGTALCAGLLAYLLPAHRLPALLSVPFVLGVYFANPFSMLALVGFGWIAAAKPNIGGVAIAARWRWRDIGIACALTVIAFALMPTWPLHWLASLGRQIAPHFPPVVWPLGVVGLIGLLRWRTAEGRALAAVTLLPSSAVPYDLLTLYLCTRTARDAWVLTACGWLVWFVLLATAPHDLVRAWTAGHLIMALGVLVPVAVMVLDPKPGLEVAEDRRCVPAA
jgi:hypothetical protein